MIGVITLLVILALVGILSTTAGTLGRSLYYTTITIWYLGIPRAGIATLGAVALGISFQVPSKTRWGGALLVAATWIVLALVFFFFTAVH